MSNEGMVRFAVRVLGSVAQRFDWVHPCGERCGYECCDGADDECADADQGDVASDELCGDLAELVDAWWKDGDAELV